MHYLYTGGTLWKDYFCENSVVIDLHGHDGLVSLDLAQNFTGCYLVTFLKMNKAG